MTRDEILEAAALIFRQKGYHAASMQAIASAVEIRKASLYHHFQSKQEILMRLLDQAMDLLIADIGRIARESGTPEARLRKAIRAYLGTLTSEQDLAAVLLLEYRSLSEAMRLKHQPRRDQFEQLWRDLIEEGVQAGSFQAANPSMAAKTLLGAMNWTITWFNQGGRLSGEEIGDLYAAVFIDGLSSRSIENGRNGS